MGYKEMLVGVENLAVEKMVCDEMFYGQLGQLTMACMTTGECLAGAVTLESGQRYCYYGR